jgi:hypothetical protein
MAKKQSGRFADPARAQNLYPHLVGDPDRWNSRIVTREANRAAHPHKGPSKRSKGVPLQKVRQVCNLVLQSVKEHPLFSAACNAVAAGSDVMQFAELHVFHQCRLSAEIMLSSDLSCLKRKVVGRSEHSRYLTARNAVDADGSYVPMHVQFFARVLLKPDTSDASAWSYERCIAWVTPVECKELSIDGHIMFEVLGNKTPLVIDLDSIGRPLILVPGKSQDDKYRLVPFAGKGLLEVQSYDDFLDADGVEPGL